MDERNHRFEQAEKILGSIGWLMLGVTILAVILTILTLNSITDLPSFRNYLMVELSVLVALTVWGVRFYLNSRRYPSYFRYSVFSLVFALIQLIFILSNVY